MLLLIPNTAHAGELIWEGSSKNGIAARLTKSSVDATASNVFRLFVGSESEGLLNQHDSTAVFKADKVDGVIVDWIGPTMIEICHNGARIWHYTNFQSVRLSEFNFVTVDIILREDDNCVS